MNFVGNYAKSGELIRLQTGTLRVKNSYISANTGAGLFSVSSGTMTVDDCYISHSGTIYYGSVTILNSHTSPFSTYPIEACGAVIGGGDAATKTGSYNVLARGEKKVKQPLSLKSMK
jgi:hypothetical protein